MYTMWPCPSPDGGTAEEMMLGHDRGRQSRLLIIAPLLDEHNKFRRQIAEIMRLLDELGVDCFCPDLPACNESLAAQDRQTLAGWRMAVAAAAAHACATHVLALRSGCWLVPRDLQGWLYAPTQPAGVLRSMLRARILAAKEAGHVERAENLIEQGLDSGIELAGWKLGAQLVAELSTSSFSPEGVQIVIDHESIGGSPLWLRAENGFDPAQAHALANLVAAGIEHA